MLYAVITSTFVNTSNRENQNLNICDAIRVNHYG